MWRRISRRKFSINCEAVEYPGFDFKIQSHFRKDKQRLGVLTTPHGVIQTPAFIFCATKAAMKGVTSEVMRQEQTQIILSNTYHLLLAPGPDVIQKMGGLQKFTGWNGPMLTDSGGYQIFSMGHGSVRYEELFINSSSSLSFSPLVSDEIKGKKKNPEGWNKTLLKITEDGATFKSYLNGSIHHLTPELSITIQRKLGADLIVVLDECTPYHVDKTYTTDSTRRSHRWALRSFNEFQNTRHLARTPQALYGIIQGGVYQDLRQESVEFINSLPVFGIAIGGSLGSDRQMMKEIVEFTSARIRSDRPIHLLGIGGVADIFHGVRQGIDTFDCVHPSRLGRHGGALVKANYWANDLENLEELIADKEKELQEFVRNFPEIYQKSSKKIKNTSDKKERYLEETEEEVGPSTHVRQQEMKRLSLKQKQLSKELKILKTRSTRSVRPHISLLNNTFRDDPRPIDSTCHCSTCRGGSGGSGEGYSRAYLHHLLKSDEMLGSMLITAHNVHFMNEMMSEIRRGIETDLLDEVEKSYVHPNLK
jgi:queuine tRNA-ribosyltransferase